MTRRWPANGSWTTKLSAALARSIAMASCPNERAPSAQRLLPSASNAAACPGSSACGSVRRRRTAAASPRRDEGVALLLPLRMDVRPQDGQVELEGLEGFRVAPGPGFLPEPRQLVPERIQN